MSSTCTKNRLTILKTTLTLFFVREYKAPCSPRKKPSFDLILLPVASHHRKCVKYVAHSRLTDTCKSSNGEITDLILDTWDFK